MNIIVDVRSQELTLNIKTTAKVHIVAVLTIRIGFPLARMIPTRRDEGYTRGTTLATCKSIGMAQITY